MHRLCNVDLALAALLVEATIGYPAFVYRAIGHPVTWMGALLAYLESSLNRSTAPDGQRRLLRVLVLAVLLATTGDVAFALDRVFSLGPFGAGLLLLAAASFAAQRSLHDHVRAVVKALERGGWKPAARPHR
jgi:adenosylcobinamide-phosphate synthase